jgi:hypothetical protein
MQDPHLISRDQEPPGQCVDDAEFSRRAEHSAVPVLASLWLRPRVRANRLRLNSRRAAPGTNSQPAAQHEHHDSQTSRPNTLYG